MFPAGARWAACAHWRGPVPAALVCIDVSFVVRCNGCGRHPRTLAPWHPGTLLSWQAKHDAPGHGLVAKALAAWHARTAGECGVRRATMVLFAGQQ